MSILRSIFKGFGVSHQRKTAYLDLMILAGLRNNELRDSNLDQIAFLIQEREELRSLTWPDVEERVAVIQAGNIDVERRLAEISATLGKPKYKNAGLKLVTSMLFDSEPDNSIDFLDAVANEFQIEQSVRADLLTPWSNVDGGTRSFDRCAYNNPDAIRKESIFEAMAHAENDVELTLLTYKLAATRSALVHLGPDVSISGLGETIELHSGTFRVDAFLCGKNGNWIGRFLSHGEALHRAEFSLIRELLEHVDETTQIFIGHTKKFSVRDVAKLRAINKQRIQIEFISV